MGSPPPSLLPERWPPPPGPSLLLSFSLELPLLFRVGGTLATSSPQATSGSSSRRQATRLTMDRATQASISSTNGRRQGTRVMHGPTSSREGSRRGDLVIQESISQQIRHLTMTTLTYRGWTHCQ